MVGTLSNTVFWLSENESSPTAKPAEPVPGEPPEAAAPHSSRAGTVAERGTKESAGIGVVAAQRVAAAAAQRGWRGGPHRLKHISVPFRSFIYRSIKPQWDRIREKRAENN